MLDSSFCPPRTILFLPLLCCVCVILKLALFGFVLLACETRFVFIIPLWKSLCVHFRSSGIGFVLHNTLKMLLASSSDYPAFVINRTDLQDRGEDRDCISLVCHELHAFFSAGSALSVVRNTHLGVAGHEKDLLSCDTRLDGHKFSIVYRLLTTNHKLWTMNDELSYSLTLIH